MRVEITRAMEPTGPCGLRFFPENETDKEILKEFALKIKRDNYNFYCRGFNYMEEEVEFTIQPVPRTTSD